ncbi:hypothetical protein IE81DRAFT_327029 [Ceraceosorus guamensis]|uniref:Uncharacterized protein n=1 Tax=Ceraceosorus guamensis TaxID=1522189 RepID=A0A316VTV1_9BASI|nr:hypothetical protein IE81DRAFT_327029 [Ceraceosorus guamensis]PWN38925.1 hypothetical protein IE81DRAFT_327029 [Ceraceosorus guamensis]
MRSIARLSSILSHLTPKPNGNGTFGSAVQQTRSIMSSGKPNASGLKPELSRSLPTRSPTDDEKPVLQALRDLYSCDPRSSSYAQYSESATFHDPVSIASGLPKIRAQFNALVALFPRSNIDKFNVLDTSAASTTTTTTTTVKSDLLLVDQDVTYYRSNEDGAEPFKTMNSLLTIERDAQGRITRHTEEWNHNPVTDSDNSGFGGALNEARKKAFAAISMPFVDQTPPAERK